ncbi:hypothetical protein ABKV19_024976 [Rosa sericea]
MGFMFVMDFNSNKARPEVKRLEPSKRFLFYAVRDYLVESTKGDLFHARRLRLYGIGIDCHTLETFEVGRLVFDEENDIVEHVRVRSIGDEAFFVGDNHSVSVLASNFPGCQPNSIYYTDDLTFFKPFGPADDLEPCDEIGIFNLNDNTVTPYKSLSINWPLRKPPALWIVPSIN